MRRLLAMMAFLGLLGGPWNKPNPPHGPFFLLKAVVSSTCNPCLWCLIKTCDVIIAALALKLANSY